MAREVKLTKAGYERLMQQLERERERLVERLRAGTLDVLVATDVAARGLDVDRIGLVNFLDALGLDQSCVVLEKPNPLAQLGLDRLGDELGPLLRELQVGGLGAARVGVAVDGDGAGAPGGEALQLAADLADHAADFRAAFGAINQRLRGDGGCAEHKNRKAQACSMFQGFVDHRVSLMFSCPYDVCSHVSEGIEGPIQAGFSPSCKGAGARGRNYPNYNGKFRGALVF